MFTVAVHYLAVLLLTIGLSVYGCSDSVSVSNEVQVPLASLTVAPGTLQPAFSSNTTSYGVEVLTAVTSVTVSAIPRDSTTTMTINEVSTAAGQERSIPLNPPGSTATISIALSSQTGGESTYTVTVTRLLSSDNNLSALSVTPGSLEPAFAPGTLRYTVDVATTVTSVTVSATKSDPNAVISGDMPNDGQATIQLGGPGTSRNVSITVTAPNGTSKTYQITVSRAASGNNNLSTLSVTPGTLTPRFAAGTLSYSVDVGAKVTTVTVAATKADPNAVISGDVPNEGQATIQLDGPGTTTQVAITVTAQNGNSKTYRIAVERAAPSSDNNLSALSVTPGLLAPAFTSGTLNYTVEVATTVTEITVSATKSDPDAVMSGSVTAGTGTATGQATLPLGGPGSTTQVAITMTAPNGASKTYMIAVNRLAPSSDNNLSSLTVAPGSLSPGFSPSILTYDVTSSAGSLAVSATKSDPDAVMSGSVTAGTGVATGSATIPLGGPVATTRISITVTAPNGVSKTYTITVSRPFR